MPCFLLIFIVIISAVSTTVQTSTLRNLTRKLQNGYLQANLTDTDSKPSEASLPSLGKLKPIRDNTNKRLRKRFDYEDTYDWEADEKTLDYETEEEEETLFQKMARNWKSVALRLIFLFSVVIMCCFCCRCCCRLVCPFVCDACCTNCDQLMEWIALYLKCGKDPAYKKFNKFAKAFGIQLDYKTFQQIKKNYGFEGNLMDSKAQQKAAENYN